MMRKIFGGTMVLSIVGAVILGGVLAFTNSQTTASVYQVKVGDASWTLHYQGANNVIVPGSMVPVGIGGLSTDPLNSMSVKPVGGSVQIVGVPNGCGQELLTRNVQIVAQVGGANDGEIVGVGPNVVYTPYTLATNTISDILSDPNEFTNQGTFVVNMGLLGNVPASCYGGTFSYTVTLNVEPVNALDSNVTVPDGPYTGSTPDGTGGGAGN